METLKFYFSKAKPISKKLYGLFFEDINFSIDGGINSNQINNARFDFRYRKPKKDSHFLLRKLKKHRKRVTYKEYNDYFRYWHLQGDATVSGRFAPSYRGQEKYFPLISVASQAALTNYGYNGGNSIEKKGRYHREHANDPAIGVKAGETYKCKFWLKSISFVGDIDIFVENNAIATEIVTIPSQPCGWKELEITLKAAQTAVGRFVMRLRGEGSLCLDAFYFGDASALGADDSAWSGGKMRRDLVDTLKELNPSFIRFPGGCIVEGYDIHNSYYWKNTVGEIADRKPQINLWGEGQSDGGYMQSYEIGFYEYFLLCEHLGAEPLPILNAGISCQGRTERCFTPDHPDFQMYIDNVLDLIEFANGDPQTNKWARIRADSGHPAPFGLKRLGIGNENWGDIYLRNFGVIKAAVKAKYPYIDIVFSAGFDCYKHQNYERMRRGFDGVHDDCIVDDHFYRTPQWCIKNANLYDDYDRKIRVFLGEYAANSPWNEKAVPNSYYSALAEAAFLTHIERNADKVVMASYAPLFSRVGGEQWKHNLINFNSLYVVKTANFYVQKFFCSNIGDRYIPDSCTAQSVFRSATTDGKAVYIKLVNIGYESLEINIILEGLEISGTGIAETLSCTDDYARNIPDYFGPPSELIYPHKTKVHFLCGSANTVLPPRSVCVIRLEAQERQGV